jgi:hypothetical protein
VLCAQRKRRVKYQVDVGRGNGPASLKRAVGDHQSAKSCRVRRRGTVRTQSSLSAAGVDNEGDCHALQSAVGRLVWTPTFGQPRSTVNGWT